MSEDQSMACCGIDCATCEIYLAAHDPATAARLAEKWKAGGNADVTPEWFRCQGCRGERSVCWCDDCNIYQCCTDKQLHNCSQCPDFPCESYVKWIGNWRHHRTAFEGLQGLKASKG